MDGRREGRVNECLRFEMRGDETIRVAQGEVARHAAGVCSHVDVCLSARWTTDPLTRWL